MHLNSHRCQGCQRNKNAAGVPIPKKIYPNLLTDSIARDLEAGANPVELIQLYNAGWYRDEGGDAVVDEGARQHGDASAAPAPAPLPALTTAPAPPRPRAPCEMQQSSRLLRQTVETELRDSRHRSLRLPQPHNDISAPNSGLRKRGLPGQDERLTKARRVEFVEGAGGSSATAATPMQ
jgi:hypothetical protein